MTSANAQFLKKAKGISPKATPGFRLQVFSRGEKVMDVDWGRTWKYYDLASLTKIIFTVPVVMKAIQEKKIDLNDSFSKSVPWCIQGPPVHKVLSHFAGHDWWMPYFKSLTLDESPEYRKNELRKLLSDSQIKRPVTKSVYSDIDFFYLGFLIENVFEKNWLTLWNDFSREALGSPDLFFHPDNKPLHARSLYAPTEKCPWRKRLLQGEVHDENAWALGGVAPQAGLFGTIDALSQWGLWLRQVWRNEDFYLQSKTLKTFSKRTMPPEAGDWALGFMLPTAGSASCGSYFSPSSIGHTGFTGTSFWFDPVQDVFVALVSNRVHPTRKNEEFRRLRPQIHNWVMEILKKDQL